MGLPTDKNIGSSALPATMLAAGFPTDGPDAGEILVKSVPRPEPAPGEVLVKVAVSAVNPTDWKSRKAGGFATETGASWVIPNQDGAGTIVACGEGVPPSRTGERVWIWLARWQSPGGTAAEYVSVPDDRAVALPDGISFGFAAGLGIPAMTAHLCLFGSGSLQPEDHVLVHGGAGAVGHAAIELAVHAGARVATTVSGPDKRRLAVEAGAELVVDYRRENVAESLRAWNPDGVSLIVEVDLVRNLELDSEVISAGGKIVVYAIPEAPVTVPRDLMAANASVDFFLLYTVAKAATATAAKGVTEALRAGALSKLPGPRFSLQETAAAHDTVETGAVGKVLIGIDDFSAEE